MTTNGRPILKARPYIATRWLPFNIITHLNVRTSLQYPDSHRGRDKTPQTRRVGKAHVRLSAFVS